MNDSECVEFLQWALPTLRLRWPGFRKVRRQVCRRIERRVRALALPTVLAYRDYLQSHPEEWDLLDECCWITITRFYRDRRVFERLETDVLPALARLVSDRDERTLRCWSIGCAGGEEPYTLAIIWSLGCQARFPRIETRILATDVSTIALERAARASYQPGSLKDLPEECRTRAFDPTPAGFCLKPEFRAAVTFEKQDIRTALPDDIFDLILCRYLLFTYYEEPLQRELLRRLMERLSPGGALVVGATEHLPGAVEDLEPWLEREGVYRKLGTASDGRSDGAGLRGG